MYIFLWVLYYQYDYIGIKPDTMQVMLCLINVCFSLSHNAIGDKGAKELAKAVKGHWLLIKNLK